MPSTDIVKQQLDKQVAEFIDLAVHDLDSPLRKLSIQIETFVSKYESGNETGLQDNARRIRKNLDTVRSLVDSLANLSKAGEGAGERTAISLELVIREVLHALDKEIKAKNAVITYNSLPEVYANKKQMLLMFRLILENALVFSHKGVAPQINIAADKARSEELNGSFTKENYLRIRICDNGLGIDAEDSENIFLPFVRLHGKSEFAGNGIGLAIVRKIVENHEGHIHIEKNTDKGTCFVLIIPQTKA